MGRFIDMRIWMHDTYGCSMELESYVDLLKSGKVDNINPKWVWKKYHYDMHIYLKDASMVNWFELRWS